MTMKHAVTSSRISLGVSAKSRASHYGRPAIRPVIGVGSGQWAVAGPLRDRGHQPVALDAQGRRSR
ncbi:hypothetical protein [Streptomyces sp. NPDC007905]|uniref:hypothetical protein n=1 Tax=Streptomyces sp. NPDC007905 TaxID=3364788 RepID=UPI0036E7CF48